jgi:iron complex transport system permease protein
VVRIDSATSGTLLMPVNGSRVVLAGLNLVAAAVALRLVPRYDLLAVGDRTAAHVGVKVERLRVASVVLVALPTGVAVAFVGVIAFVGLVPVTLPPPAGAEAPCLSAGSSPVRESPRLRLRAFGARPVTGGLPLPDGAVGPCG